MCSILIIGANSFIGTNFIKHSEFRDIKEISVKDKTLDTLPFKGYDVILYLAAIVHQNNEIPESEYLRINRDLCLEVTARAKKEGVKHFIFLSTLKVYGNIPSGNIINDENSECIPTDPYGKSKLEAEIGLKELEGPDFIVSVIRTPLVYGEGVKANMLSLIKLVEKIRILPFKNTGNRRNYTYVGNLVGFIDRIIEKKASGTFIVKDNETLSTDDLVKILAKNLNTGLSLFALPGFVLFIFKKLLPHYYDRLYGSMEVDNTKTKKILDYQSPYSADEGISRMISAYQKNKY